MIDQHSKFVSSIESRLQDNGELYGRFHLGTFVEGQALTVANALRRTLLSEIPGFVVTSVQIEGANHEFATLPGIHESVLNILLNIKRMAITTRCSDLNQLLSSSSGSELQASIALSGPGSVTAGTIKFPSLLAPVCSTHAIATLSSTAKLNMRLKIAFLDPLQVKKFPSNRVKKISEVLPSSKKNLDARSMNDILHETQFHASSNQEELVLDTIPKPVRQVNFSIHEASTRDTDEYISLEVWTDGSIQPKEALTCALEKLTRIFYEFTTLQKLHVNEISS